MKKLVWIDCDTGVDDAIAIMAAHVLPELELVGISTVCGNTTQENAFKNTHRINALVNAHYPIYRGAERPLKKVLKTAPLFHGENGLGDVELPFPAAAKIQTTPAWDALYECAKSYKSKLHLVATGPLTNIAIMLEKHPDVTNFITTIYIMGGAIKGGNVTPNAEFNIYADPEAADNVFRSGMHVVMFPLDVTLQAEFSAADLDELAASGTPAGRFAHDCMQKALRYVQSMGRAGVAMHDSCPVMYLAHPEFFSGKKAGVVVETTEGEMNGNTATDMYSDKKFGFANATVMLNLDKSAFVAALKDCIKRA